jgi:UDP-GlcNAc:undecaprenyl-phosphate GlcNAc-1-phosphate transferase
VPGDRKVHASATPLGGGLAIWLGVVGAFGLGHVALENWQPEAAASVQDASSVAVQIHALVDPHVEGLKTRSADLWIFLAAASGVMLLGLVDDWRTLDWRLRLTVETALAAALVFGKGWRLTLFLDAPLLTGALSVLWIVGLVNSFNMLDNMDGLSAGVATIAAGLLAAVLLIAPNPVTHGPQLFVAGFLLVLAGSLAGFLVHNRPPARLFMGDAGSYFVGFSLGVATLLATFTGGSLPRHAILAPLCVLAVPLYDTVSVVFIRLRAGRSPFAADRCHFSHRLVDLGLTKKQAVLTIYLASATCGLGALVLHEVDTAGAVVIGAIVVCTLGLIAILESSARKKIRS